MKQKIRWGDGIVIALVVLLAGIIMLFLIRGQQGDALYAEIYIDGALTQRIPLEEGIRQEIVLDAGNTIYIDGLEASISHATCSDQVCVRTGKLTRAGQSAVCLPNRVVLKLQSTNDADNEVDAVVS